MQFEWNKKKNKENIKKHGLDFEFAKQLFNNDLLVVPDRRYDYKEDRYLNWGKIEGRLMMVVYTERSPDIIRIISFRKANDREEEIYKKNRLGKG